MRVICWLVKRFVAQFQLNHNRIAIFYCYSVDLFMILLLFIVFCLLHSLHYYFSPLVKQIISFCCSSFLTSHHTALERKMCMAAAQIA